MRLHPEPFEKILRGEKTFEVRLHDEKRQLIQIGDEIVFTDRKTHATIVAIVTGLIRGSSFVELFKKIDPELSGLSTGAAHTQAVSDVRQYYSEQDEKKYGTVAILFKVLDS